jgi:hypothetical protein
MLLWLSGIKMEYKNIFRHRGWSYDLAMRSYPNARNQEFYSLFDRHPIKNN